MTTVWGIHNDDKDLDFVAQNLIAIGWDSFGDVRGVERSREHIKARLLEVEPMSKPGAIPVWAGVLFRFAYEMAEGDIVVYPDPWSRTINVGRVLGEYRFDADATTHRSRRSVEWVATGIPRDRFTQGALFEIGSALTLFRVRNHAMEFLQTMQRGGTAAAPRPADADDDDVAMATEQAEEAVTAQRIEESTRDFIVSMLLKQITSTEFEHFVADVLRAHGYRAEVTPPSGDWGVDVVAFRDPLGVEPPRIKVQCKQTTASMGGPDVARLVGALAGAGHEIGVFVTLGTFTRDAVGMERGHHNLKLIDGDALVRLVLEAYDALPIDWKQVLPLKRAWVVDTPH